MWRIVEPVLGHDVARDALSSAMGTLATYLGNGRSHAAYELFGGSRSVHDVDAYLGRDRTRMLVADVLELGASVESGYMGDVTSAMAHLAGTLAGLGVELDRSRVCRHAMRLLAQPPRRYHSRSSAIMSWATCIEQQVYVRGLDVAGAPGQHHDVLLEVVVALHRGLLDGAGGPVCLHEVAHRHGGDPRGLCLFLVATSLLHQRRSPFPKRS